MKQTAINSTGMIIEDAMSAFFEEEDVAFAEAASPANLKLVEGLIKGSPDNEKLLLMACQFYTSYAFGFLEAVYPSPDDENAKRSNARAKVFYKRAMGFGLKLLHKNAAFHKAMNGGTFDDFEKALQTFDGSQVPSLFWTAFAWGNYVNLSRDDTAVMGDFPKVTALMKRIIELDEKFYYGGPHLFSMVSYCSIPAMLGGDIPKATQHYKKAKEISQGKFLMTDYIYARYCAVQSLDRELFDKTLKAVIDTPADIMPSERLTNEMAKKKAQILLGLGDEIF
jgi:hypothetical protein